MRMIVVFTHKLIWDNTMIASTIYTCISCLHLFMARHGDRMCLYELQ